MGKDIPSPWHPIQAEITLAVLGKLNEELGELISIVSRTIIQGLNETDPDTGVRNIDGIQDEIADVIAACKVARDYLGLNDVEIGIRAENKIHHLKTWHSMLKP